MTPPLQQAETYSGGEGLSRHHRQRAEAPVRPQDRRSGQSRRPLLRGIDRTLAQFKAGSSGTPTGWYQLRNNVVALTVKVGSDTLTINGVTTNHMPAEQFEEFLKLMRAEVEAGEFDAELAGHGKGEVEVNIPRRKAPTISPKAAKARGIKAAASRKANHNNTADAY